MHSAEEQGVEMEESESEESAESDSRHDTVSEMSKVEEDLQILSDVSFWEIPVPDHLQVEIIKKGSASFQNRNGPFSVAKGGVHQLSKEWFYIVSHGEKILRSWMVYSLVSKKLYCFCCRLFAASARVPTSKFVTGFRTWQKLNPEVHEHEVSEAHLNCFEKWRILAVQFGPHKAMSAESIALVEREEDKWRDILHSLCPIILFLAKQNLPFRHQEDEEDEEDETSLNKGNFLAMVELLSGYDSVVSEHLMKLKQHTREANASLCYLSPNTQNEFISALANHVKERLVMDMKSAKYFGITFDPIPETDADQIAKLIRYVEISNGKVEVREVFLGLLPFDSQKAADLGSDILKSLEEDGLDIMLCRAQGYDNVNMTGIYGAVQALIKEKNKKAIFNGCVDHSLNMCGRHAFAKTLSCASFMGTLDRLFSFFTGSTCRWDVLIDYIGVSVSVEKPSRTRWSAHHVAVKLVKENFDKVVAAIEALCDPRENIDTREKADCLWTEICDFTFLCYLYFWCDVLQEVDLTQQYLQTKGLTLDKMVTKLEVLELRLLEKRSRLVEHAIEQALVKSEEFEIPVEKRIWRRKTVGEQASDAGLSPQEENKREMLESVAHFHSELQIRSRAIKEVAAMFEAVQAESLISATEEELKVSIPKLTTFYDELSESELLKEIPSLRSHLIAARIDLEEARDWAILDILKFIAEWYLVDSLPTLSLSLKLFLTICASVTLCERDFSKLERIKNYLQSTMGQLELSDLAILSVEDELAGSIDFSEMICKFAAFKVRKGEF